MTTFAPKGWFASACFWIYDCGHPFESDPLNNTNAKGAHAHRSFLPARFGRALDAYRAPTILQIENSCAGENSPIPARQSCSLWLRAHQEDSAKNPLPELACP